MIAVVGLLIMSSCLATAGDELTNPPSDSLPADLQPATVYYVAATLGDDQNDGRSPASPWRTVEKVNATLFTPGTHVLFKRGDTWTSTLVIPTSGTPDQPILFGAYGRGERPIITGQSTAPFSIRGTDRHHIVVQDLELADWTDVGLQNRGGDNWVVRRLRITGGDTRPPDHGIRFVNQDSRKIDGGLIEQNVVGPIGVSERGGIFYQGILVQGIDHVTIRKNTIRAVHAGGIALSIGGGGINGNIGALVEDNLIYESTSGILVFQTSYTTVQYNTIRHGKGLGIGVSYQSNYVTVQVNLIYGLVRLLEPHLWNGIDIANDSHHGKVYHNTVVGVARHSLVLARDGNIDLRGWDIRNNIFDASRNDGSNIPGSIDERALPLGLRNATAFTEDHDLLVSANGGHVASVGLGDGILYDLENYRAAVGAGLQSQDKNPHFIDPDAGNFRLRPGSPAIGMGDRSAGVMLDMDGVPFADPPSIGAYEIRQAPADEPLASRRVGGSIR